MITVRFLNDGQLLSGSLDVLFELSFELGALPRVEEFVVDRTKAVYQITGIIHMANEDARAMVFATTRLVRAAPLLPPDI